MRRLFDCNLFLLGACAILSHNHYDGYWYIHWPKDFRAEIYLIYLALIDLYVTFVICYGFFCVPCSLYMFHLSLRHWGFIHYIPFAFSDCNSVRTALYLLILHQIIYLYSNIYLFLWIGYYGIMLLFIHTYVICGLNHGFIRSSDTICTFCLRIYEFIYPSCD